MFLLTATKLQHEDWPWECIEDTYLMDLQQDGTWAMNDLINSIAYKMRAIGFDRFIALDDFDVDQVAHLREHFRMPGMGATTARYFRDKLAMRMKALEAEIPVPQFTGLFKDADIQNLLNRCLLHGCLSQEARLLLPESKNFNQVKNYGLPSTGSRTIATDI